MLICHLQLLRLRAPLTLAWLLFMGLSAHAADKPAGGSPRQMIDHLGVTIRQILEQPGSQLTPDDAERAVANQISDLIARAPGHLSLTEVDSKGRTPLMLAASGAYPQIVKALLDDPSVKLTINMQDERGETAWMLANFAPAATLIACEPGSLTLERYVLLPPYLRRLGILVKPGLSTLAGIIDDLEHAGAEIKPDEAKRAWLSRCPNATPELRQALDGGNLFFTLVHDSLEQLRLFNQAVTDKTGSLPNQPPDDMAFVQANKDNKPAPGRSPLLDIAGMTCSKMPTPPAPPVSALFGHMTIRAFVVTRAGVVEGADFKVMKGKGAPDKRLFAALRNVILQALAKYQCDGDHVFEQVFAFNIE